jgi:3-dehydroquinate synthase
MKKTALSWLGKLPDPKSFANALLVYDQAVWQGNARFRAWAKKFPARYGVQAGESLKDVDAFPGHVRALLAEASKLDSRGLRLLAVGGGSVGDFVGFAASVLWRGRPWINLPSTWLAALDSAHGGKTALNVGGAKNQLGTFHAAERVVIVDELLRSQDNERAHEAMAELLKIALIDGGSWTKAFLRDDASAAAQLARFLKPAVAAKYKVVARDPFETKGQRRLLNLGHTLGHVVEAAYALPHGTAVAEGLYFALEWSWTRGFLDDEEFGDLNALFQQKLGFRWLVDESARMTEKDFLRFAGADKKKNGRDSLDFIFLKGIGRPLLQSVKIEEFLSEAEGQGWVR